MDKVPNYTEVKSIFNDVYNKFFLKWKDIQSDEDFNLMWKEVKEIQQRHEYDLCKDMLFDLCKAIEQDYMVRNKT